MKLKIGKEQLRITKNQYNRFWNPIGMFRNSAQIIVGNKWFRCNIELKKEIKNIAIISFPFDKITPKKITLSNLKAQQIRFYLNNHKINYISHYIRTTFWKRKNTIIIMFIAFLLSFSYFILNKYGNNKLLDFIATNLYVQSIIIFLTISSFINIFFPFTVKKPIDHKDINEIAKQVAKKEISENRDEDIGSMF